ncbi:MAG: glycosyl hydrolase family 18 protein [Aminipila sp.]
MKKFKGKRLIVWFLITVVVLCNTAFAFAESNDHEEFKVVGYYSGDLFNEPVEKLQTDKMTHIMYAFLIPNEDGTIKPLENPEQLSAVVSKAHSDGCKVFIALGGWSYEGKPLSGTFDKVAADDKLREKLMDSVVNFTIKNKIDGVEIDWEYPNESNLANYEKLVVGLSERLKANGKELTAALSGAWSKTQGPGVSQLITDKCLNSFDFINVMAYDMNNGEHSPLWFANTSIEYWLNRGVPANKIVLGLPLYARPSWMQYRHLVEQDKSNAYKDYVATIPNESYYNSLRTLREKTNIAIKKAGGVMFFDVNEDVDYRNSELAKYSAVSTVYDSVKNAKGLTQAEKKNFVTVVLNNELVVFNKQSGMGVPYLDENHRTLVPMRKLLETIGAKIQWDNQTKTVTASKLLPATNEYPAGKNVVVNVTIGDKFITANGKRIDIDTKAVMKDGRTYIPVRAVLEAFGYDLSWNDAGSVVYIQ